MESGEDRVDTREETVACATHNQVEDSVDGNHCDGRFFFTKPSLVISIAEHIPTVFRRRTS